MTIIYTQELKTAIHFALNLGGLSHDNKILKEIGNSELEEDVIAKAQENHYIRTSIGSDAAVIIWGKKILEPFRPNEYEQGYDIITGFIVPEVKFRPVKGYEKHIEIVNSILNNEAHEVIYDASLGGERHIDFACLYKYANCKKDIKRVEISSLEAEDIKNAFNSPMDIAMSHNYTMRDLAHIYTYYIANSNIPLVLNKSFKAPYPKAKELPVLAYLVERYDEIQSEIEKNYFTVSIKTTDASGNSFFLTSKDAKFSTKEEAQRYAARIPASTAIYLKDELKVDTAKGPHSAESIEKEAEKAFKYSSLKTHIILSQLYSDGFITTDNTKSRSFPKGSEERILKMYDALEKTNAFKKLFARIKDRNIPEEFFSQDNKSGILITKKSSNDPSFHDSERRNIYYLICKEIIKPCLGSKVVLMRKASVKFQNITFSASGEELKEAGYSILDRKEEYHNDIPKTLRNGDIVNLNYAIESKLTSLPLQRTQLEVISEFTGETSKLQFENEEIRTTIDGLERRRLITRSENYLIPTEHGIEIIHFARKVNDMLQAPLDWEKLLSKMVEESTDSAEAGKLASELESSCQRIVKQWHEEVNELVGIPSEVICPKCGAILYSNSKGLLCKNCEYSVSRIQYERKMKDEEFQELMENKRTSFLDGFTSDDKNALGRLILMPEGQLGFTIESDVTCPKCGSSKMRVSEEFNYCPSCDFKINHKLLEHEFSEKEFTEIMEKKKSKLIEDLIDENGEVFNGVIYLDVDEGLRVRAIKVE